MTSFNAFNLFFTQLKKLSTTENSIKFVKAPTSLKETGAIVKVSMLKAFPQGQPRVNKSNMIRVRVSVEGTIESETGLKQAMDTIEILDEYLLCSTPGTESAVLHLEDENKPIPNSRIITQISVEDSFIDSPDATTVQDLQDERIITITYPKEYVCNT